MSEYSDIIKSQLGQSRAQVVAGLDDNPDDAAKAVELSNDTGVPSQIIAPDLEGFQKSYRADLATNLVMNNPALTAYVHSHPMAASVSNDDWGTLDSISGKLHNLREASDALSAPFQNAIDAAWKALNEPVPQYTTEDIAKQYPALGPQGGLLGKTSGAIATAGLNLAQIALSTISSAFEAQTGAVGAAVGTVAGERAGREAKALSEYEMIKPEFAGHPWVAAGHEPPAGVIPELDKSKAERNEALLKGLEDVTKEVQQSTTWERSPELFKNFVQQHLVDRQISIAGDAVTALYGDKVPSPDDGLLGWVPGIGDKILAAHVDGSDVEIPLADWLTHMDPAVAKGLHDNVRMWPEGVTKAETTVERPEVLPPSQMARATLLPATKLPNGTVRTGRPGQVHGDLFTEDEMYGKEGEAATVLNNSEMGFVSPDGKFLDRKQAAEYVEKNEPHLGEEGGKLEALGYYDKSQKVAQTFNDVGQIRAAGGLEPVFRAAPGEVMAPTEGPLTIHGIGIPESQGGYPAIKIGDRAWTGVDHIGAVESAIKDGVKEADIDEGIASGKVLIGKVGPQGNFVDWTGHPDASIGLRDKIPVGGSKSQALSAARSEHPMIIGLDTIDPKAVGLPAEHWQRLQELAQAQFEDDLSAAQKRADRQAKQRETAEWKDNRNEMQKEVEADLRAQPAIAADLFLGSGEFQGQKLRQRFTLREDDLTDAQKALLPDHYISKNGLGADDVAAHFGYGSGDSLIEALAAHNALKGKRSAQVMFQDLVKFETDRRMEAKYGDLPSNIFTAAHDQALSETTLNLVTQEYQGAAMGAGVEYLRDQQIREEAKRIADSVINRDVNSRKKLAEVSKNYSDAVKGLLGHDPQAAVVALQRRAIGAHVAKELMDREKQIKDFNKVAAPYAKRWDPLKKSGPPITAEWSLAIRDMLGRIGMKNGMPSTWMAQEWTNSRFTGLQDFVTKIESENQLVDLHLPVPDFMYEAKVKNIKDMTGDEFRAVSDAITATDKLGRADQKIEVRMDKITKDEWIAKARLQLGLKFEPLPAQRRPGFIDVAAASSTSAETVFHRWDNRDPHGLFTETFIYPMAEGSNFRNRVEREESGKYKDLGEIPDKHKKLDSPIIDPHTNLPWANFTRENLHAVISNMGNSYNWRIANEGWGTDPDLMMKWVEAHSDVKDIQRAQGVGISSVGLKPRIDTVDRNVYGIASESVQPRPFVMHGQQFEGWYHPIVGDPALSRYVNKMPSIDKEPANFWPSVYNKFLKKRTGAVQFISLDYDAIPTRLLQEIHYLAMHEPVMNAAKLIRDNRFRDDVIKYYGKEYLEVVDNWLHTAAGDASFSTGMMAQANKWSGILRQNVVNTQIAFNIGTVEKHGPTAFMYSLRELAPRTVIAAIPTFAHVTAEVAPGLFKHAVLDMFGKNPALGDSWFDFVLKNSEEIQRRVRNYQDTMMGVHQMFDQGWSLRNLVSLYGAKMVAFSDMLSAAPLWLARYRQEMAEHGQVGDAIRAADFSVRRAHGSTAVTSRPMITTGSNPVTPWLTSLYGFMGTSLQRRIEIMHDINDAYKLGRQGDIGEASKMLPQILSGLAIYVLWTGYVEEKVTGQFTEDHRGALAKTSTFLFGSVANAIIGLRDLAYNLDRGGDTAGMISNPGNDIVRVMRDLKKPNRFSKQNAGRLIEDTCIVLGDLKGYCPKHMGAAMRYGYDAFEGLQKPRDAGDIYRGMITGSQKLYQRR